MSTDRPFQLMGRSWSMTYMQRVQRVLTSSVAVVYRPDGKQLSFNLVGGLWVPAADITDRLEQVEGGWKYTSSNGDLVENFDSSGNLLSITNRQGLAQTLTYFSSGPNAGLLQTVTDPLGRTLSFTYNANKLIETMTDPDGNVYTYSYDVTTLTDGLLESVTYPDNTPGTTTDNPKRTYHYNEPALAPSSNKPWLLTGITDENNVRFANFGYNSGGYALSSAHAGGANQVNLEVLSNFTQTRVTDALGGIRTYNYSIYQSTPLVLSITGDPCPSCGSAVTQWAAEGFVHSRTDWNGNRTCYTHDSRGLEILRVEGLASSTTCPYTGALMGAQRKITTQWHATYRLPTQIAEPLRITTNVYGAPDDPNPGNRGSLLSRTIQATTDASGGLGFGATLTGTPRVWTYTYNANGQVLTINGPRTDVTDVTTYGYYANNATCTATVPGASTTGCRGQVQSITNAAGHITTIAEYNAHGQPLLITDPNGLVTTLAYDTRMRLVSRDVGGELITYTYDNAGQLTRVTLPDSSALEYQYDAAHRLTEIRLKDSANALVGKTVYTLDAMGNRTQESVKDAADVVLQARSREYNNLNRLFKDIGGTNPAVQITQYGYDNQGNLTSRDGPLSGTVDATTYAYDALNRLATQVDPSGAVGGTTTYGYSGLDQLTSVTDPRTLVTSYSYDGLNNLNQLASPDTGATVNTYDTAGNVSTSTDAKSQVTSYTYDALNRVTSITYQGGVVHTYQYDQGVNGLGRLTTVIEPNSTTQYAYDQKGRLTSETRTINAVAYVTGYSYDGFGRLTGMAYPGGRTVTYTLDALGRIQSISTTKDSTTQTVVSSVAYRPFGPMKSFSFGNGQTYTRGFDLDGRIASYTLGNQSFPITVGYDEASRITLISDTGNPNNTQNYGYDALDRLMSLTGPAVTSQNFTYDPVGNRATKTVGANTDTYNYFAASNRLNTITGTNPRTYTHDLNGSISDSVNSFGYDTRGRLTQATSAIGTSTYRVNSLGQRIRKTNSQGDTVYHYDAQGRLIAESSPSGQIQKEYFYLGDTPVAVFQ